jgi:hypothetical protein
MALITFAGNKLTYQRLVKTTPNPSATKKSNGELVLVAELGLPVFVGAGVGEVVGDDILGDSPLGDAGATMSSERSVQLKW